MKLTDDFLMQNCDQPRRVLQMSLYALYLANGGSIWGRPLKSGTVDGYLRAAASLIHLHSGHDPRYDRPTDKTMSDRIHSVLKEMKRVEDIPDRLEPYTPAMHQILLDTIDRLKVGPDSFLHAMKNWNACNMSMGCRLREYAQNNAHKRIDRPEMADNNTMRAFTLNDIVFFDSAKRRVSLARFLEDVTSVHRIEMTWSWQKNLDHGQTLAFESNHDSPDYDFIINMHEILCRFDRLVGMNVCTMPIGVYKDAGQPVQYIHEKKICDLMKNLAIECYHLDPKKDKIRYGSHSVRIGACVALHAAGATETQIQFLLRWKSKAFFNYLRKIGRLCQVQNAAITLAASQIANNSV